MALSYEKAKELKDNGFSQDNIGERWYADGCENCICNNPESQIKYPEIRGIAIEALGKYIIKIPTLEELIEACGEEFEKLELCSCMPSPHDHACVWDARPKNGRIDGEPADKWDGRGDTPSEAVANLWLALNKK